MVARSFLLSLIVVNALVGLPQANVIVTTRLGSPVPNLPGYESVIFTATSDVPNEPIWGIDFVGDRDDHDPATAKGFFGPMNQVTIFGEPTVFEDLVGLPIFEEARAQDSHFLFKRTQLIIPTGYDSESPNSLRAVFGSEDSSLGFGQSVDFAQLVLPTSSTANIFFRGQFAVNRAGEHVTLPEIIGVYTRGDNFPPDIDPILRDITLGVNHDDLATLQLLATDDGLPPNELIWSDLVVDGPGKNPNFPAASDPQLNDDGIFSWNPNGWRGGQYLFTATVGDGLYTSTEVALTVNLTVPEPATIGLLIVPLIAIAHTSRRR